MEIFPNVHRIQSIYRNRVLSSYLLMGERVLMVDSGFAFTPQEVIIPYMENLGLPVERINWLINTHASGDHHGGNYYIKQRAPNVNILAHERDAPLIADHELFIRENTGWTVNYGLPRPEVDVDDPQFIAIHGPECPVDMHVRGEEIIWLEKGRDVRLIHTPGHTPGHLAVYDTKNCAVYLGDAVLGSGVPDVDGNLVMPPHYFEVDWYLGSIQKIRALNPTGILATHYKPMQGKEVNEFLNASERFVAECNEAVLEIFGELKKPLNGPTIRDALREIIGIPNAQNQYNLIVRAHLNQLLQQGRIAQVNESGDIYWRFIK